MMLSDRVKSNMEFVLEETCRELPHGGDHESRRLIAEQLLQAAEAGQGSLGELRAVALQAFVNATKITRQ
ncbi:hypothetical protein [Bradyrhizobium arachidis]|uniref:Uncharacterized protein n=1 Tax=Bradyrhizobium arachidis TaxID=858423 RepID=A0A1I7MD79_9BRAD|nr:hypothetical protein [Bradyrhizobium arachidis]QOZ65963.1 hypothetical protein WN72_05785 [Bradyrhizobium arachidis]QOZ67177.1 hypothetical protein WN72_13280 [Bradyrhizobium arachidis]SFV16602.1 hypothetical protein SAMN05192541_1262 [Bradyrhizobium arachidis]SFV19701.1 hypothetical protein SAMN05192541_1592 [Bradyrhizobium arachidis]SFV19871.1 hypothetical protein SAMN05192541_1711 [Bradyrhizobium arachidis]